MNNKKTLPVFISILELMSISPDVVSSPEVSNGIATAKFLCKDWCSFSYEANQVSFPALLSLLGLIEIAPVVSASSELSSAVASAKGLCIEAWESIDE